VRLNGRAVDYGNLGRFVALELPAGEHRIRLHFRGVVWANVLSAATWLGVLAAILLSLSVHLLRRIRAWRAAADGAGIPSPTLWTKDARQQATVAQNVGWFCDNHHYAERLAKLESSQHTRRMVEREVNGVRRLLDVGNSGFFNYATNCVESITAVDLFLQDGPGPCPNISFRGGSLLDLPFQQESFDCVLGQYVLHHVTGRSVRENHANLDRCLAEMFRVLSPGGKAVIMESVVGPLFYGFECLAFRPALWLKRGGHPVTFQFTPRHIIDAALACGFQLLEWSYVPRGKFLLQFGYVWPSVLTPARPIKLILGKPAVEEGGVRACA
jgi:SAM-dependent methyltransferase